MSLEAGVVLCDGHLTFKNPEARIREYCELEVYDGYDNFHAADNVITERDIEATKRLFSMIDRYGNAESISIINSAEIPSLLSRIPDLELGEMPDSRCEDLKKDISALLSAFLKIKSVGLAKTVKILHLKRPHLFPILDSYVVEFLTGINPSSPNVSKQSLAALGVKALDISRSDIKRNQDVFGQLEQRLQDLPIALTTVRMFDILCWSYWKWDYRGNRNTTRWVSTSYGYRQERGYASKSVLKDASEMSIQ